MKWYYAVDGQRKGPVTKDEFERLIAAERLDPDVLVWRDGMPDWLPLAQVDELGTPSAGVPPQLPPPQQAYAPPNAPLATGPVERRRPWQLSVLAVVWLLMGLGLTAGGIAIRMSPDQEEGLMVLGWVLAGAGLVVVLTAIGLWMLKGWGRILAYPVSVITGLMGGIFGLAFAILVIVYLASPGMSALFSKTPVDELGEIEKQKLAGLRSSGLGTAVAVILIVSPLLMGLIAAIAIPNLLGAIQRGKQKRTMGDLRTIATAVESYSIDENAYPNVLGTAADLEDWLEPTYIKALPTEDGWNTPFLYELHEDQRGYRLESFGKDGVDSGPEEGPTTDFRHDIVFDTGSFLAYPDGRQQ